MGKLVLTFILFKSRKFCSNSVLTLIPVKRKCCESSIINVNAFY